MATTTAQVLSIDRTAGSTRHLLATSVARVSAGEAGFRSEPADFRKYRMPAFVFRGSQL